MIKVKVTQPGRTEKSTIVVEGTIESLPKIKTPLVVKNEANEIVYETDPAEAVTHHVSKNAYTVKVGRHQIKVEILG